MKKKTKLRKKITKKNKITRKKSTQMKNLRSSYPSETTK